MSAEQESTSGPHDLVVVGTSAGGVEALSMLVSTLPKDFPAPIILAQHLDPNRPSQLGLILQRRSSLPVVPVTENVKLEVGKAYLVPSNRHVAIEDGHISFLEHTPDRPKPSLDLLLTTAAQTYGDRLVAVVLTGSGSDGAAGAVEVKNAGGTVIIQNPETARYPSMPLALPPTVVDHVADIERMGPLIYDLLTGLVLRGSYDEGANPVQAVLSRVSRQSNIDFRHYKPATILRRINRRMAATHTHTIEDYTRYLDAHPEEVGALAMSFLIKVTEFFRDPEAFIYLRDHALKPLIEARRTGKRTLRLWSAGCATGEEPYSLALIIADLLGDQLSSWNVKIFATDVDEDAVNFARRGLYPANVLAKLPESYRARYFDRVDHGYRISKNLRQMVIFGQQDLSRGVPFPRMDLVVCRNLLIYFKPELQQHVLDLFAYSLNETGGYLFLGQAETARPSQTNFELVNKKWKLYKCVATPQALPISGHRHSVVLSTTEVHFPPVERDTTEAEGHAGAPRSRELEVAQMRRFYDAALRYLPVGVAVVDRRYHTLVINGVARRLLSIRDAGIDQDFLHSARTLPYGEVRGAIDAAFRERTSVTIPEVELTAPTVNAGHFVSLIIAPMQSDTGGMDLALISVTDVSEQVQTRRRLETAQAEQRQLVEELQSANRQLSYANKELQDANEELQATNEELMLTQEELQATNEEFEATNEELQATNEELETNNEELQATNEELETTNEELTARTAELQELTRTLASERLRLSEMVELAPFYITILRGPHLLVDSVNSKFESLLGGGEVLHQPFASVFGENGMAELVARVEEVYRNDAVSAFRLKSRWPGSGGRGRGIEAYFDYVVIPIHETAGKMEGVVIYAEDVTEQMQRETQERREKLKLMVEHADQVALGLFDAQSMNLLQASPRYIAELQRVFGYERAEILGRSWEELTFVSPREEAVQLFRSVVEGHVPRRMPEVRVTPAMGGQETVWDISLTPIPFGDETDHEGMRFVALSAIEVTEQVRSREEVERLDQLKDTFLSVASHELRTPLVPLMGYADMLAKISARKDQENDTSWDPRVGEYVDKFRKQISHMNRLVDDLFAVTRIESGKFSIQREPVDLAGVLQDATEAAGMFSPDYTLELDLPRRGEPLVVLGDRAPLSQVVLNLIQNATKYAPSDKPVELHLRRQAGRKGSPGQAVIEVRDYGTGIAEERQEEIFNRFYQVNDAEQQKSPGGLGLGLFISRAIVEQHGGTISVESTPGEGSTFAIRLPLVRDEREAASQE